MANNYLDKTGLQHFWSLLKTKFSNYLTKTEAASTYLGKTAKAESAKTADSATKATQDGNGLNIATNYAKLSEAYFANPNAIKFTSAKTDAFSPNTASVGTIPFTYDTWHDHFAFLNSHRIEANEVSADGTTWTSSDDDLRKLFNAKQSQTVVIMSKNVVGRRITIWSNMYHACLVTWFELCVNYTYPFSKFSVLVECSADRETWSTLNSSNISGSQQSWYLPCRDFVANQQYVRFTFLKTTELTTGSVEMNGIKALTYRKGNQGLGSEYEFPYNWDVDRNIFPWVNNAADLGTASLKWKNIYSYAFTGNLVGKADKATADADGNTISSTYLKKTDASSTYLGKNDNAISATTATKDSSGNIIADTYVKNKLAEKSYSNVIINNVTTNGNCQYYYNGFATIAPTTYEFQWKVRLRIESSIVATNGNTYVAQTDSVIYGYGNISNIAYANFNAMTNTSYRPFYYIRVLRPVDGTQATQYPFRLCFYQANQYHATNHYSRNIKVTLLEQVNCVCTLFDTLSSTDYQTFYYDQLATAKAQAKSIGYWTYSSASSQTFNATDLNCVDYGLQETGDANSVDRLLDNYFRPYNGTTVLNAYKLCMMGNDNRIYPLVTTSGNAFNKAVQTVPLRPDSIWYYASSTQIAANGLLGASVLYRAIPTTNCKYTFNSDLAIYRTIYLCGDFNAATGLFTLETKDAAGNASITDFYVQIPTNEAVTDKSAYFRTGKYYILLGGTYSSANYLQLFAEHPMYYFDGTNLVPVVASAVRATSDKDGNEISSTYVKKTDAKPSYNFSEINNKPTGDYVTGVALTQSAATNNSLYTASSTAKTNLNNFAATITSTNRSDKKYLIFSTGIVQDSHVDTGSVSVELSKDFSDSVCEKGTIKAEVYYNGTMYNAPFYDLEIGTNKNLKLICNNGECYVDITYTLTNAGVLTFSKYDCYRAVQGTTTLQVTTAKIDGSSVATSDIPLDTLDVTVTKTLQAEQDILGNTIHNTYLPLKGGTLSGNLIIGAGSTCIKKAGTTSNLLLYADSGSTSKNAVISLHGSEVGTAPGVIHLRAGDGTTTKSLMLYPNGDIKWDNTNISLEGHTHSQYLTSHQSLSGYVPTTRTINSKALSSNITLSAADVSAVPTTRKVNNKALSADITLSASDVSAVPTTRTVNGKALSANITLSASDVGAAASSHTHDQYKYSTTSTTSYGLPYWEFTSLIDDSTNGFDSIVQIGRYGIVANANTKGLPDANAITAAAGTIGGILEVDVLGAMSGISSYARCVQKYYKINSVTKGSAWMRVGYYKSDTGWTWGTWEQLIDNDLADSSYLASNKLGTIAFDTNSGSKILIKDTAMAKGDTLSGTRYSYITFGGTDVAASNAKILGNFGTVVSSTDTKASMIAFRNIASSTSLGRIDVVAPTDTTKAFYATAPSTPANSTSNEIVTADYISDVVRLSSGGTANATTGIWYSKYSDGTIVGHGRVTVGGTVNAGATKDISVTLPVSASSGTAFSVAATCSHSGMNVGIANTAANKFTAQVRNITTSNINAASVVVHFNFIAH